MTMCQCGHGEGSHETKEYRGDKPRHCVYVSLIDGTHCPCKRFRSVESECRHLTVPDEVCLLVFAPAPSRDKKRSTQTLGYTTLGEILVADLDDNGKIYQIEIVGGKPCQK